MVRPVSVGRKARLSLSLSLSLFRTKKTKRAVFEREDAREVAKMFSKVFSSLFERFSSLFSPDDAFKNSLVFFLFESHRARPRKDGQSLGDSTVRGALVLYLLASDALVFSRARASGPTPPRDFGREREKGLKIFEFSPPLCVSLSQFFPNIE